jgi:hypothetical protein
MTAISAHSANGTLSTANSLRDLVASLRTVVVPGSPATFANRAELRAMGLRWDSAGHRWHGTTTTEWVRELRERLGLEVRVFGALDTAPKGPTAPRPVPPVRPAPGPHSIAVPTRELAARAHDGARTRLEARIAFLSFEEEEENPTPTRRFSIYDITSGLPDDSREEDEREEGRRLRDLRGRLKHARALVASTPWLADVLASDWKKATMFYAQHRITEGFFRGGVTFDPTGPEVSAPWPMGY